MRPQSWVMPYLQTSSSEPPCAPTPGTRRNLADVLESAALGGAYDVHHAVVAGPFLALAQHFLEEAFALRVLRQLEVVRAFVRVQCQEDDPRVVIAEERRHAVLAHVGGHGDGIHLQVFEERAGIHGRGVADVAALGRAWRRR